jgi:uncharacterized protein YkwD
MRRTLGTVLTALLLAAFAAAGLTQPAYATPANEPKWAITMLTLVNAQRAKAGVKPLTLCAPLSVASSKYARVMARTGRFDHTGPDGRQPWDRGEAEGYHYRAYGENIAAGQPTVRAVMTAWVHSPGHYANIVSSNFTDLGVGHASASGTHFADYWVQDFGAGGHC